MRKAIRQFLCKHNGYEVVATTRSRNLYFLECKDCGYRECWSWHHDDWKRLGELPNGVVKADA